MGIPQLLSDVPDRTPYKQYVATNGQTVFPYPFPITQDSDLVVVVDGVTLGTDTGYSLTGVGNDTGGNVMFTVGLSAAQIVTVYRDIQIERITQIGQNSGFASSAFNAEYNNIYLIMQQLASSIDFCLQIPNTNNPLPVTELTASVYANKYLAFDAFGNPTPAVLTSSGSLTGAIIIALLTQAQIASVLNPQTPREIVAGVSPIAKQWYEGDIRRYGPALDGVTDDTTAVQNWAKVGGHLTHPVVQTALISTAITLSSNSTFEFAAGATLSTATHGISMFYATGQSKIVVRGGHFLQTSAGTGVVCAGVYMTGCTDCLIEGNDFEGMQYAGVWMEAATRCTVRGNRNHDVLGSEADSACIYLASAPTPTASVDCTIENNFCDGATFEFGVACWDPYAGTLPQRNIIRGNHISDHNGYGILLYMTDVGNSYTQVLGNQIRNISAHSSNTSSGAGIYLVGAGAGGTVIADNVIRNCCITTSVASLAPAGIGVSQTDAGTVPVVVSNNIIEGMVRYNGILMTGVLGGASVVGNTVRMPTQTGTIGSAIGVTNSNNVTVAGNTITLLSTTTGGVGILLSALGAGNSGIIVSNNTVNGGHAAQIRCTQTGGNQNADIIIANNRCSGGDASSNPLVFDSTAAISVMVSGNIFRGAGAVAVSHTTCQNIRYENNLLLGSGAILTTSGVCTGSHYGESNLGAGIGAGISNGATGFIIDTLGAAIPSAGTWGVGDKVRNTAPSTAGVLFWVNTVAGSPGTFKTVSNT